jgi:hypothetical protein
MNLGKYPYELGKNNSFKRETYDLVLILSIFFNPARLQIFNETLCSLEQVKNKITVIGIGAAVELELIKNIFPDLKIEAYDLSISQFVKNRFEASILNEREFNFKDSNSIESFLLIEILEHLDSPYLFLEQCSNSLVKSGNILCTTSCNMPQFDHLHNFYEDDFNEKIKDFNMYIRKTKRFNHELMNSKLESYNEFYHLIKK